MRLQARRRHVNICICMMIAMKLTNQIDGMLLYSGTGVIYLHGTDYQSILQCS